MVSKMKTLSMDHLRPRIERTSEFEDEPGNSSNSRADHMRTRPCKSPRNHRHKLFDTSHSIYGFVLVHPIHHASFYDTTTTHLLAHRDDKVKRSRSRFFRGFFRA